MWDTGCCKGFYNTKFKEAINKNFEKDDTQNKSGPKPGNFFVDEVLD